MYIEESIQKFRNTADRKSFLYLHVGIAIAFIVDVNFMHRNA